MQIVTFPRKNGETQNGLLIFFWKKSHSEKKRSRRRLCVWSQIAWTSSKISHFHYCLFFFRFSIFQFVFLFSFFFPIFQFVVLFLSFFLFFLSDFLFFCFFLFSFFFVFFTFFFLFFFIQSSEQTPKPENNVEKFLL